MVLMALSASTYGRAAFRMEVVVLTATLVCMEIAS